MPEQVNTYDRIHGKAPTQAFSEGFHCQDSEAVAMEQHNAGTAAVGNAAAIAAGRCNRTLLPLAWLHLEADLYSHTPSAAATGQVDAAAQP